MTNERNAPCWCGSGKKYKKCHRGRENEPRPNFFEAATEHRKRFFHRTCLHPEASSQRCTKHIVRAHSVRRAADLSAIAETGHVIQLRNDPEILHKTKGRFAASRVGINDASTFTGFCGVHDAATFAPLETQVFEGSTEQCFLLFYRAWARELYTKLGASNTLPALRSKDSGLALEDQRRLQTLVDLMQEGIDLGLRDLKVYKSQLDKALISMDFGIVESLVIEFADPCPFMCSGATYPYWDVDGGKLQHFDPQNTPEPLAISVLQEAGKSFAILSWIKSSRTAPSTFANSLRSVPDVSDALCRVCYSTLENVFADPRWWRALPTDQQSELLDRASENASPFSEVSSLFLRSRGQKFWHSAVDNVTVS